MHEKFRFRFFANFINGNSWGEFDQCRLVIMKFEYA